MQIRRLTPALGAEITGLDLTSDFDDATLDAVHDALVQNQVLVIHAAIHASQHGQCLPLAERQGA